MPYDKHSLMAFSTVSSPPSPATSGTVIGVTPGDGVKFDFPQNATVWPVNTLPTKSNAEVVRITGVSGDNLTVIRAQEGTTAQPLDVGYQIGCGPTPKTLTDIENSIIPNIIGLS